MTDAFRAVAGLAALAVLGLVLPAAAQVHVPRVEGPDLSALPNSAVSAAQLSGALVAQLGMTAAPEALIASAQALVSSPQATPAEKAAAASIIAGAARPADYLPRLERQLHSTHPAEAARVRSALEALRSPQAQRLAQSAIEVQDGGFASLNRLFEGSLILSGGGLVGSDEVSTPRSLDEAALHHFLSLGERIARGVTKDEGLRLAPWEPLWEGDRPAWRMTKDGEHLLVQYVPEDLSRANPDAAMARLMQEIFRAVYGRPNLIEPHLQSNGLFQTLHDALETGRVVQKGVRERPGLAENFSALNREQYGDPSSEAAALRMKNLPNYLRYLEGVLYEGRTGQEDPRIKDRRVLDVLKETRALRERIARASPEEAYELSRELWSTIQKLYAESETAAMSQKLFEKLGREGKLGLDKDQSAALGKGRLKLDDIEGPRLEQVQKKLEKALHGMSPLQREALREQARQEMERQEQSFRKTLSRSPEKIPGADEIARQQLEQAAARLSLEAAQAASQAQDLREKASKISSRDRDIRAKEAEELNVQAEKLRRQADRLSQSAREFRQKAELLKQKTPPSAAEKTLGQARKLEKLGKDFLKQSRQMQKQTREFKKQRDQGRKGKTGQNSPRQKAADIEKAAKKLAENAEKMQEEARNEQASPESQESNSEEKSSRESSASSDQAGQDGDPSEQTLKERSPQKDSDQAGESGDSSGGGDPGQDRAGGGAQEQAGGSQKDLDKKPGRQGQQTPGGEFGTGTSDSLDDIRDEIEKIKSGGLDAGQRNWLDAYLEPVRGMIDTLAYKIRKHLKASALGRDINGLFEGDVDEDALPYYKARIGIMKEELLPRRPKSRITFLLDLSGSMKKIGDGGSLDHASRALLMALKAFKQAFKSESGAEIRVVAYNENPQLSIIGDYIQVKNLNDAALYGIIERINEIQNTSQGNNSGSLMMEQAVEDIQKDMKAHSDTTYALLHIGDGDPGADIGPRIRAIYDDPANAKIRFANLAAGPQSQDMYDKYQPYSFWARELSELGAKWAEIVEAAFKKSRGAR